MIKLSFDCPHPEAEHQYDAELIRRVWPSITELVHNARGEMLPTNFEHFEYALGGILLKKIQMLLPGIEQEGEVPAPGIWLAIEIEGENNDDWSIAVIVKEYWRNGSDIVGRLVASVVAMPGGRTSLITPPPIVDASGPWPTVYLAPEQAPAPSDHLIIGRSDSPAMVALMERIRFSWVPRHRFQPVADQDTHMVTAVLFLELCRVGSSAALVIPSGSYLVGELTSRILLASLGQGMWSVHTDGTIRVPRGLPEPDEDGIVTVAHDLLIMSDPFGDFVIKTSPIRN